MSYGMAHEMERGELEAEIDALFERSDARIHKVMDGILQAVRASMIIDSESNSYNANRGIYEETITHHDPDHKSR